MVFREFATVFPIKLVADSASKQPPPQPDILCPTADGGFLAFEMVSLDDPELKKITSDLATMRCVLAQAYFRAVEGGVICGPEYFSGLGVFIHFKEGTTLRQRKMAADRAIRLLAQMKIEPGHRYIPQDQPIEQIEIYRNPCADWVTQSALIDIPHTVGISPPDVDLVIRKLAEKEYQSEHTMHLLAHYYCCKPLGTWINIFKQGVLLHLSASAFDHLWLYDQSEQRIIYTTWQTSP